jgi:hypothetical protein
VRPLSAIAGRGFRRFTNDIKRKAEKLSRPGELEGVREGTHFPRLAELPV